MVGTTYPRGIILGFRGIKILEIPAAVEDYPVCISVHW